MELKGISVGPPRFPVSELSVDALEKVKKWSSSIKKKRKQLNIESY